MDQHVSFGIEDKNVGLLLSPETVRDSEILESRFAFYAEQFRRDAVFNVDVPQSIPGVPEGTYVSVASLQ